MGNASDWAELLRRDEANRARLEEAEQERKKLEEQRKKEFEQLELARREEEERRQEEEQQRLDEERSRQNEASREDTRLEALLQQEEALKQKYDALLLSGQSQETASVNTQTNREAIEDAAESLAEQQVSMSYHKPFIAYESSRQEVQDIQSRYDPNMPDNDEYLVSEDADAGVDYINQYDASDVQVAIHKIQEGEELDGWWLKASQTVLLTYYFQATNGFSSAEEDILLDFLATLQMGLTETECLSLSDSFSYLTDIQLEKVQTTFTVDDSLPLTAEVASMLLQTTEHLLARETNVWMQRCLQAYVAAKTTDVLLPKLYSQISCREWSGHNWLKLFNVCNSHLQTDAHKKALHLIETYSVKPQVVMNALEENPQSVLATVETEVAEDREKLLVDIFHELKKTKLVEDDLLGQVETIVNKVDELLGAFNIKLDYEQRLQSSLQSAKIVLGQSIGSATNDQIAEAMITLYCACQKFKGWYPHRTQLVALLLLLLSSRQSSNLLLEVLTGEGKSLIVALFATILALQSKHVDVVTSSHILAMRDVEEWQDFYSYFNITVTHNADPEGIDENRFEYEKRACYGHQVVYGTVGNFAADILRDEFEQKNIRDSVRRFDTVIVDEVDMLMLDEGVQFTYLSHNAAILRHIEPLIAAIWGLIGTLGLVSTDTGQILYAGQQKLFTQAVYECLDPELTQVESQDQVLTIANQLGVISTSQYNTLIGEDQEAKKPVIADLTHEDALNLIIGLEDYENTPEFLAYIVNSEGSLEAVTSVTDDDFAEKLVLLDKGQACILSTQEEVIERGVAIMQAKLSFSDTEDSDDSIRLPKQTEEFVLSQLPVYVENAVRALHMEAGREYTITRGRIVPVDFQNSGVMELNKRWGGGLQQMIELKHKIALTPVSLVTNFLSNLEFFSRYGAIFGASGTLGLDENSNTQDILSQLYNTKVCTIPTFKYRKLLEKPTVIVDNDQQWFQTIAAAVREESQEIASWKKGRATLILCEDIKTAEDLKKYMLETENWDESKLYLYAHSNSTQLTAISKKLSPKEIIIATNLAGRGTNIEVTDEVNASGGLFCLVTFLPRNRRVEWQAFGRTARSGHPGSAQCILNYSSLPAQYDGMSIEEIRRLRADEESIRLQHLIDYDVKEVQLREELFKKYCEHLGKIHQLIDHRSERTMILEAIHESWAQWLETKRENILRLESDMLSRVFLIQTGYWTPTDFNFGEANPITRFFETGEPTPSSTQVRRLEVNMVVFGGSFHHYTQCGRLHINSEDTGELETAYAYFGKSIEYEPKYSAIAYYNRAYVRIRGEMNDHKNKAREDIQKAIDSLNLYIAETSTVAQCAAMVRQAREFKDTEEDDYDEEAPAPDLDAQIAARYEILRFLKQKMEEAVQKIDSISGGITAEPSDIFSLIPDPDYATNLEIARMWTLGLEVVYTIEEKPEFCWEALVVFFLGVAQVVAGVLLTVFTAGAAAQFGMALIGEGISDCIDGIEGMITGEFSWAEWAITKATGIALSLVTAGVSRLATAGFKAIKAGFKIASKVGRQLKAIPKIVSTTSKTAAKNNLKTAAKYVGQEAILQGVSYTTARLLNMALEEVTKLIGTKMKERFMTVIQQSFSSGYLGEVVDGKFVAELSTNYRYSSSVPQYMQNDGEKLFNQVGDTVSNKLNTNSEVKERLTTASLSLFSQLSQRSKELRGIANLAEAALVITIVSDTVASLSNLVDQFSAQMEEVCRQHVADGKIVMSGRSADPYRNYSCVTKFKNDLADHVGDIFGNAVASLLQGKLRPLVNQYQMTNKVGRMTNRVLGKYILKTDRTMEELRNIQHANYIRAVGFDTSGTGPASSTTVAKVYASKISSSDTPGSLMELRIAAEHYGQKVTVYTDKSGKLVKDSSINPSTKNTQDEVELVYIPPTDPNSVGHYDVLIRGDRRRVEADQSNCLFHAYAYAQNTNLTRAQLGNEATRMRETVATSIANQPHKFGEHIKLRIQMENLRRGRRYAMIGAGPPNEATKILDGFYKQELKGDKIFTMYEQENGIKCRATRKYNKTLSVNSKNVVQEADARLETFEVTMDGLNLHTNAGKRCWDTKPVVGMIKRPNGDVKDTEVSYHLCPSRGGANAGDQYANAIPASTHYNNLEKYIWSNPLKTVLAGHDFTMTVKGFCGPLDQDYQGSRDFDDPTKQLLKKRYDLIQTVEPRAYRLEDPTTFTVEIPAAATVTQKDLDDIAEATHQKETQIGADTDLKARTVTFYMPQDYELFTPTDVTNLQPNGELYAGELTTAKIKQKKITVNKPPYYRRKPKGTKTAQDKIDFANDFAKFVV